MSVYTKLQKARVALASTEIKKSGNNKFAGYQYFELADFLNPIQKIFNEIGLCGTVTFESGNATLTIRDSEKPDDLVSFSSPMGTAHLKGCHEVQNIGAVQTYQRRYLYIMALEIVEHDAIDSQPLNIEEAKPVKKPLATKESFSGLDKNAIVSIASFINAQATSESEPVLAHDNFVKIEDRSVKEAVWGELTKEAKAVITEEIKKRKLT